MWVDDLVDVVMTEVKKIPASYHIEIGVFTSEKERKIKLDLKTPTKSGKKYKLVPKSVTDSGITNAEIMFIQENGSYLRHIPKRPVLAMTIEYANKELLHPTIDRALDKYFNSGLHIEELEKELNRLCIRMENYARHIIYDNDGRLESNAPSVIKAKGDNHPLFDTGQLARAITCRLVKD